MIRFEIPLTKMWRIWNAVSASGVFLPTCARFAAAGSLRVVASRHRAVPRSTYASMSSGAVSSPRHPPRAPARLVPANRARLSPLVEFVTIRETSVSLPFAGQSLPAASSSVRVARLCRRIRLRDGLALRGESAEPGLSVSLSSTLGFSACSSRDSLFVGEPSELSRFEFTADFRTQADRFPIPS